MTADEKYMQRCLELASAGLGNTAPNPMVGAVIVHDGKIIGEGYHRKAGMPHAEVEAVRSVRQPKLLPESTLYVNLEPCNHTGKTPPCTDLILEHHIPRLVVAHTDPNPLVSGAGLNRLRNQGVEITTGILEAQARDLNRRFIIFHEKRRPFIILKWAQTRDGFIDIRREIGQQANPAWITDDYCRSLVHRWRTEEAAVLIGTRTAILDNPRLNVRSWARKDPPRLVIDLHNKLPRSLHLFDESQPTLVFSHHPKPDQEKTQYLTIDEDADPIEQMLEHLYQREIQSIIVEGGAALLSSIIKAGLWDEARVFRGPGTFGQGVPAPEFPYKPFLCKSTGNSTLDYYRKSSSK